MLELFHYLNSIYPLTPEVQMYIMQALKKRDLPANYYWLREGDVCNKIAFIEKGLVKIFYTLDDKEIIVWFNKENDITISVKSFFNQQPSQLSIKTIEPTIINYIDFKDLDYIYEKYACFNINARKITEQYYCLSEDHLMLMHFPPRERYHELLRQFAWMEKRLTDKYLAAYLGITNVALSKFKNGDKKCSIV
jgi:CRP-like cAMP-binding protein